MGQKNQRVSGLYKRGKYWHIDKEIYGQRISRSTGTADIKEAIAVLDCLKEEARKAMIFGVRPKRTFKEAAIKYIKEEEIRGKKTLKTEVGYINGLMPFIGDMSLDSIHDGTLEKYVIVKKTIPFRMGHPEKGKRKKLRSDRSINYALKVLSQILKRAVTKWRDENNLTWLSESPAIELLPEHDKRLPRPITWNEQDRLFAELPAHLQKMALFMVNTGCRDGELCPLKWEWEVRIPELNTSVFVIPGRVIRQFSQAELDEIERKGIDPRKLRPTEQLTKNGDDRMIVLNQVASEIVESVRGQHPTYVFSYRGKNLTRMNNKGWRKARLLAGLEDVRVHDLRHTFGRRLRAAGVSFEDRQDLLGHKSGRVTTHYSSAEIGNLIKAAEFASIRQESSPTLRVLRGAA